MKTAILLGSTGLTGSYLLQIILDSTIYSQVIVLTRKKIKVVHDKLIQYVVDFDKPDQYKHLIVGDDLFCCLGTTIKKAGSQGSFRKVDLSYPIDCAKIAQVNGVEHFLLISAIGADSYSSNFYMKTKGECEDLARSIAFRQISILRPSLLTGNRKEFRLGEKVSAIIMQFFSFLFIGKLRKYRPISAQKVANAMFQIAQIDKVGCTVYESNTIDQIS